MVERGGLERGGQALRRQQIGVLRPSHPHFCLAGTRFWQVALLLVLWGMGGRTSASGPFQPGWDHAEDELLREVAQLQDDPTARHVSRALAAGLALTLGLFGGHRIYLGAPPKIPLIYGLTFGGFGVLVLIDLGHILFTKDLAVYQDNQKVLMWAGPETEEPTPP